MPSSGGRRRLRGRRDPERSRNMAERLQNSRELVRCSQPGDPYDETVKLTMAFVCKLNISSRCKSQDLGTGKRESGFSLTSRTGLIHNDRNKQMGFGNKKLEKQHAKFAKERQKQLDALNKKSKSEREYTPSKGGNSIGKLMNLAKGKSKCASCEGSNLCNKRDCSKCCLVAR